MTTVSLTCPCGHIWDHLRSEPVPADLRTICPVCAASQNTLEPSSQDAAQPGSSVGDPKAAPAEAPEPIAAPGRVVEGFEIMEEINRGGMGVIYKARQIAMNRLVALKAINPTKLEQPGTRDRFRRRCGPPACSTTRTSSRSSPRTWTARSYLAMEYVPESTSCGW